MMSTINLGFAVPPELRRAAEQYEAIHRSALLALVPFEHALESRVALEQEVGDALVALSATGKQLAQAIDDLHLPALRLAGDLEALTQRLSRAADELAAPFRHLEMTSLFGDTFTLDLAQVAQQVRLSQALTEDQVGGLLGRISLRVEQRVHENGGRTEVGLEDVVAISVSEVAALDEEIVSRLDPASLASLLLTILFGFISIVSGSAVNERMQGLSNDLEAHRENTVASFDSVRGSLQELVDAVLASKPPCGELDSSHILTRNLHLRAEPSATSESIGSHEEGTKVRVLGTTGVWTRVAVAPGGDGSMSVGWMYGRYLRSLDR